MSTSIVCARCATLQESTSEMLPRGWLQAQDGYLCPRCSAITGEEDEPVGDILHEEVIYPDDVAVDIDLDDTLDDLYCEVCKGPCQGH